MQIFRELAGYSYGRADIVRRAMSKKKLDVMEKERETFISGCEKNDIDRETANIIFDQMSDFAKYAFNKSHAACYALVAYRTAYLKYYYPAQFMAALMTSVLDQSNKIAEYTAECKRLGLRLGPPNINTSMKGFTANGNVINYGLLGIKNVGNDFIDDVVNERKKSKFTDLLDFCKRMQEYHFNRRAVESLIRCGAMDCFGCNRRQLLQALPSLVTNLENYRQNTKYGQVGFFDLGQGDGLGFDFELPDVDEFPKTELLKMEKDMTGLYLSGHPMDKYADICNKSGYANTIDLINAQKDEMSVYKDKSQVKICGIITHIVIKQTRNGGTMAFVTLEDLYGSVEVVVFPKTLEKYGDMIYDGSIISVFGNLSFEEQKDPKVLAGEILPPPSKESSNHTNTSAKKKRRNGLFLRFESMDDKKINLTQRVTSIFDGTIPLYYYYTDSGKYELQPRENFVEVNETEIKELKRILGDENVAFIR